MAGSDRLQKGGWRPSLLATVQAKGVSCGAVGVARSVRSLEFGGEINWARRLTGCGCTGGGAQGDFGSQISVAWVNGGLPTEQRH